MGSITRRDATTFSWVRIDIGRRIVSARCYAGFSQQELAERIGVSQSTIDRWEDRGKFGQRAWLPVIAQECGVPLAWFFADWDRLSEILADDTPDWVRQPGGDAPPPPPTDLPQPSVDPESSGSIREGAPSDQAAGAQ